MPAPGVTVVPPLLPPLFDWPPSISTAVTSVLPLTGSVFVAAISVIDVPDGAVSGTLLQAAPDNPRRAAGATAIHATRAIWRLLRGNTMRASKYNSLMDLAGQGASAGSRPFRSRTLDDQGYVMAVLLIGMAITAVWMSALLPAWRQQVTRQREQDLIFRGEQYARAVALFYVRNQCTLPTNVDDLVARKFLRKKWKDPITNDDFILVPGAQPGQGGAQQPGATPGRGGTGAPPVGQPGRSGATPVGGVGGGTTGTSPSASGPGRTGQPTSAGLPSGAFPGQSNQSSQSGQSISPGSGIAGVVSKSSGTSIMIYNGQQTYSAWQFMYQNALRTMGQTPQCGQGQPGARPGTQPGQPGGPAVAAARPRRTWRSRAYRRPWRRPRSRRRVAAATGAWRDRTWTWRRGGRSS